VTPTPFPSVSVDSDVSATVPGVLALRLSDQVAAIGSLTPGIARDYDASIVATVTSSAANATLTVADASDGNGRLTNGTAQLASPLLVRATNATTPNTAFAPLTGISNPLTLLTWNTFFANDSVTITVRQRIGQTEPLTAGGYTKTITFTLSSTTP
jgi:X-X-X-Leu-X-X-Gly heptad repeat protein